MGLLKKITNRLGLWNALIFKKFSKYGKFDIAIAFRQCSPCYHFVLRKVSAKRKIGFVHGELKFMNNIHSWQRYMIKFDTMAYVSNAVKNEFIKTFPELSQNSCTIYNMFDKQRIIDLSKRKNHLSFNKDIKNIVTIARIDNDFKRINLIPIICKQMLEKTETKFHWYIIGDGPNLRENQELIKEMGVEDVLTLCGSIENPYSALKEADFSVLISKSEAYPMCVIESFILQVPVVTTKFPSVYEMMENGKQGLITDFSVEDITRKIITMIDNNKVYSSCKENLMEVDYSNELAYSQFMAAGKV